jgi:hypothetical protein
VHYENPGDFGALRRKDDPTQGIGRPDQKTYDQIGELMIRYIQEQMTKTLGLVEVNIPDDEELGPSDRKAAKCNIFMTRDFIDPSISKRKKSALVLIQGTG